MDKKGGVFFAANFLSAKPGSYSVAEDLVWRLKDKGYQVIFASRCRSGIVRGLHMLLKALICRPQYNMAVIDLYSGRAFLWGRALAILFEILRCPFYLILRGGGLPEYSEKYPKRVEHCFKKAANVISPSDYLRNKLRKRRSAIVTIPNAMDINRYPFILRKNIEPKIIWMRAFHKMYNPLLAVRVLEWIRLDYPEASLTMIGPDKKDGSLDEVMNRIKNKKIENRFIRHDGVAKEDVAMWLNSGNIFLNTTNVDNTPMTVMEAMACGLCVVSTHVGGVPYLLDDGENGLLVPPNDDVNMANAVKSLLKERGLCEKLSTNARKKAETWDWSKWLPKWESLLESAYKKKG